MRGVVSLREHGSISVENPARSPPLRLWIRRDDCRPIHRQRWQRRN